MLSIIGTYARKEKLKMIHTTHKLTPEQKENLFQQHKDLIYMIYCCNGYMLRRQIRKFFHLLSGREEMDIEFDITELILTGFLLQKTINKDTRTQMLYLSKYPKSKFMNVERSGDVPAIFWSNTKIFEHIFRVDYILEKVIPDMQEQHDQIDMDNIITYLQWTGSNLLLSSNQSDMLTFYNNLGVTLQDNNYTLSHDFLRDMEIAQYDKDSFEANQLKKSSELPPCVAKIRRDKEADSYNSDIEKYKQFYHLKNFAAHGFYIESMIGNTINLCYFDSQDNLQTKKLYQQLCYILLMFQRYTNNYNIELHVTVYVWDKERAEHLRTEENKKAFDFYRQEWVEENKKYKVMKDIGLLRQYWDSITTTYTSEEIYPKYNVHL